MRTSTELRLTIGAHSAPYAKVDKCTLNRIYKDLMIVENQKSLRYYSSSVGFFVDWFLAISIDKANY